MKKIELEGLEKLYSIVEDITGRDAAPPTRPAWKTGTRPLDTAEYLK